MRQQAVRDQRRSGSKAVDAGYENAVSKWIAETVPSRYSELTSQMTSIAAVEVSGNIAWVVGMESVIGKNKAGEALSFDALVTDTYEKDGVKCESAWGPDADPRANHLIFLTRAGSAARAYQKRLTPAWRLCPPAKR